MKQYVKLNENDNVAVALTEYNGIKAGHKFATKDIKKGEQVIKYGYPIGYATVDIKTSEWVHTHNLKSGLGKNLIYDYKKKITKALQKKTASFQGYKRKNGNVGTRNDIFIICTVGCVNSIAQKIAAVAKKTIKFDGDIEAITQPYGCSQMGEDQLNTQKILSGLAKNPNAGGVLILSLGCENNNIKEFTKVFKDYDTERAKFLILQQAQDDIEDAVILISELEKVCENDKRAKCDAKHLKIGLKCGGSDGFSGITANALVGSISDEIVSCGGTSILTEVPEMFGSEQILLERCVSRETFDKTVCLVNDFKDYFNSHNQVVYENPSPGNKDGGITTLEEKSLGCTNKSGFAEVKAVYSYGDIIDKQGLVLLNSPGNDIVAQTALAAAGANLILFTTGRGTPLGCVVPTIKIASNSTLATNKPAWIDFDAGRLLNEDFESIKAEFFNQILQIASGKFTKNEENGYKEIAIFKNGVTL